MYRCFLGFAVVAVLSVMSVSADDRDPTAMVNRIVDTAGGREKLLELFRFKEVLSIGSDPDKPGKERVSVVELPNHWWLGTKQRADEPAMYLVWVWTLGALVDERSKIEPIADIIDDDVELIGLRISGSIDPPLDAYFSKNNQRLARIDWRADIHRFSDWKEHDGAKYPSKCVGYKKASGKPWYFTEIVELERLKELPANLKR